MSSVKQTTGLLAQVQTEALPWSTVFTITAAIMIGVFVIAAVGFAGPEVLHNAAHDIRHGLAFPCH